MVTEKGFKCAYITHSPDYSRMPVYLMKRHMLTDEVFVLLEGEAIMLTLSQNVFTETVLKKGETLVVEKATYHYLAVSEDARVFVTERDDTGRDNTEILTLETPYKWGNTQ